MSSRDYPADVGQEVRRGVGQDVPTGQPVVPTGQPVGPTGQPVGPGGDASLGQLVGRLGEDLSRLMRAELALAKAEPKEEATQAARGAGMLAGAGVAGHLVLIFVSLAVMFGIGAWLPLGWSALIVGIVWAIAAAVLASSGRTNLRRIPPPMNQTVETVKEDAQWARKPRG